MRSRPVRCLAAAALLVLPFAARADQLAAGDIVVSNAGTYLARETGTIPAPGTAAGTANGIDRWVFLGAAPICMTMGVRFGFEYHLAQPRPDAGRTLQVMNDHPPMHLPDGRVVAHEQTISVRAPATTSPATGSTTATSWCPAPGCSRWCRTGERWCGGALRW